MFEALNSKINLYEYQSYNNNNNFLIIIYFVKSLTKSTVGRDDKQTEFIPLIEPKKCN